MQLRLVCLSFLAIAVSGCGISDAGVPVTKQEEYDFRNPPKEIPPDVLIKMQKSREEGMRRAAELRKQAAQSKQR